MIQLIALIIFLVSVLAIAFILYRKVPLLVSLPKNGHHGIKKNEFIARIEKRVKDYHFRFFTKQFLLHKLLSKFKLFILKLEGRVDARLHGIRKKAQELEKQVKKRKSL